MIEEIKLRQKQRQMQLSYSDGSSVTISCYDLRVNSPSAENKYGNTNPPLPIDKNVNIVCIEPVGHYGIKIIFDDEHKTGIYSWEVLESIAQKTSTP